VELTPIFYLLETGPNPCKCIDRSFQTDARAKLARPDVGIASDA